MSREIDLGLFARLMRLSPGRRKDLLEYVGQAPALTEDLVDAAERSVQTDEAVMPPAQKKAPA